MDVQEYVAQQTERMSAGLAHFVATTHEDKLQWQPQVEGSAPTRSVLEQVAECVGVNRRIAGGLRGAAPTPPPAAGPAPIIADAADAKTQIQESGAEIAAAIRTMTEADMEKIYETPRGKMLGANLILMPLRNMAYHAGQINLIQMLAGDSEFHFPPEWR